MTLKEAQQLADKHGIQSFGQWRDDNRRMVDRTDTLQVAYAYVRFVQRSVAFDQRASDVLGSVAE